MPYKVLNSTDVRSMDPEATKARERSGMESALNQLEADGWSLVGTISGQYQIDYMLILHKETRGQSRIIA